MKKEITFTRFLHAYLQKNKKKVRLIIHNQYPIVERTTSVRTHFLYISSPSREILHCFHLNVTPCMRISRRSSRLTFEKTFLIVATTWRRTRFLDRFHSQVSPDLSTFPHCPPSPRLSSFHASLLPRGRTLEHPTLPLLDPGPLSRPIQR